MINSHPAPISAPANDDYFDRIEALAEIIALMDLLLDAPERPDPLDRHFHKCKACSHVWSHTRSEIPDGDYAYEKAHTCPECREGPWLYRFRSADEAREKG